MGVAVLSFMLFFRILVPFTVLLLLGSFLERRRVF